MKKIYLVLAFFSLTTLAESRVINIRVSDYQFSPSNALLNVGDTITWMWESGMHTTTSVTVPAGAGAWSAPIDVSHPSFSYVAMIPGGYSYHCNFHYQMGMTGIFTVTEATGIKEEASMQLLNIRTDAAAKEVTVELNTSRSGMLEMSLYNIIGKEVKDLGSANQAAGEHTITFSIADLAKGIYMMRMSLADADIVRKIIVQ